MSPKNPLQARSGGLLLSFLICASLGTGCSSTGTDETSDQAAIRVAVQHGRFEDGVRMADELRRKNPDDHQAAEIHRLASLAYLLDQGRQATFRNDDVEAMDWFLDAEFIAPDTPLVQHWLDKTRKKLEAHWLNIGHEAFADDQLSTALHAYLEAARYVPDSESALKGFGDVTLLLNYRNGLGDEYYNDGVRSFSEYWLERARRSFAVTNKYQPDNLRATRRTQEVDNQLADQRVYVAQDLEAQGYFFGALNEFRLASILDPENPAALEGIERVSVEAQASELLRDAQMKIYRKEYDEALDLLDEGEQLTKVQKERFTASRDEVVQSRLQGIYDSALNLEHDQLYAEAIEVYSRILGEVEYFKDVRARQSTLQGYVDMAAGYYQQAADEADPVKKLEFLRAIEGFWPDYMDIKDQIAGLEK